MADLAMVVAEGTDADGIPYVQLGEASPSQAKPKISSFPPWLARTVAFATRPMWHNNRAAHRVTMTGCCRNVFFVGLIICLTTQGGVASGAGITSDVQYIATQNFLVDLPLRQNSFASHITSEFLTAELPEYQHYGADNPCEVLGDGTHAGRPEGVEPCSREPVHAGCGRAAQGWFRILLAIRR